MGSSLHLWGINDKIKQWRWAARRLVEQVHWSGWITGNARASSRVIDKRKIVQLRWQTKTEVKCQENNWETDTSIHWEENQKPWNKYCEH